MVYIRDRYQELMTIHRMAGHMVRQLVDRGCRKPVAGSEVTKKVIAVGHDAPVVDTGISHVDADGVVAVALRDRGKTANSGIKRFVPFALAPVSAIAEHWFAQPIRVFMNVFERNGLGAHMSVAQRVVFVAADVQNGVVFNLDFESADCLAQMTCALNRSGCCLRHGSGGTPANSRSDRKSCIHGRRITSHAARTSARQRKRPRWHAAIGAGGIAFFALSIL